MVAQSLTERQMYDALRVEGRRILRAGDAPNYGLVLRLIEARQWREPSPYDSRP